jgi:endonuclease/exonuclease/phosphatase family metal-dependent hydrolase
MVFRVLSTVASAVFLTSMWGCTDSLRPLEGPGATLNGGQSGARTEDELRVASYNIEWLTHPIPTERRKRLQGIIGKISPSILGLQEVEGRRAVEQILDDSWEIAILDSRGEEQEVALAVKKPLVLESHEMLYTESRHDGAFPNDRDLLRAVVKTPGGARIAAYVVHLKSRRGGRVSTDPRRMQAAKLIAEAVSKDSADHVIVMGDFNDTPNDLSLNLLEKESGLVNLMESLYDTDHVTVDLERFRGADQLSRPRIRGAKDENERFRNRNYNYEKDVRIKPVLFDQILVSPSLAKRLKGSAEILWTSGILDGTPPTSMGTGPTGSGTRASDHLPVFAAFQLP